MVLDDDAAAGVSVNGIVVGLACMILCELEIASAVGFGQEEIAEEAEGIAGGARSLVAEDHIGLKREHGEAVALGGAGLTHRDGYQIGLARRISDLDRLLSDIIRDVIVVRIAALDLILAHPDLVVFGIFRSLIIIEDELEDAGLRIGERLAGIDALRTGQMADHRTVREIHFKGGVLQRFVDHVAVIIRLIRPLGQTQRGKNDVAGAGALIPAVQHFTVVHGVETVTQGLGGLRAGHRSAGVVPEGVLEVRVDDRGVGADAVLHEHVDVSLVDALDDIAVFVRQAFVNDRQELSGEDLVILIQERTGGISPEIIPGAGAERDAACGDLLVRQHMAIEGEDAVAQRMLTIRIVDDGPVACFVGGLRVIRQVVCAFLIVQILGDMELHPVAGVHQIIQLVLILGVGDLTSGENDRVVRGQIGERSAGGGRLLEAALIRQVDRAVGIELDQRVRILLRAVGIGARQLIKADVAALRRLSRYGLVAAVKHGLPGRLTLKPSVQADGDAVHGVAEDAAMGAHVAVLTELGGGDLDVARVIDGQGRAGGILRGRLPCIKLYRLAILDLIIDLGKVAACAALPGGGIALGDGIGDLVPLAVIDREIGEGRDTVAVRLRLPGLRSVAAGNDHIEAGRSLIRTVDRLLHREVASQRDVVEGEGLRVRSTGEIVHNTLDKGLAGGSVIDIGIAGIQACILSRGSRGVGIQVPVRHFGFVEVIAIVSFGEVAGRENTLAAVRVRGRDDGRSATDGVSHIFAGRRVLDIDRELGAGNIGGSADSVFLVDPELGLRLIVNGVGLVLHRAVAHRCKHDHAAVFDRHRRIVGIRVVEAETGGDRRLFIVVGLALFQEEGRAGSVVRDQQILKILAVLRILGNIFVSASRIRVNSNSAVLNTRCACDRILLEYTDRDRLLVVIEASLICSLGRAEIDLDIALTADLDDGLAFKARVNTVKAVADRIRRITAGMLEIL